MTPKQPDSIETAPAVRLYALKALFEEGLADGKEILITRPEVKRAVLACVVAAIDLQELAGKVTEGQTV